MIVNITYGDISRDGHEKTSTFEVDTNYSTSMLKEALDKGQELSGFSLDENLNEYEDDSISIENFNKLKELGFEVDKKHIYLKNGKVSFKYDGLFEDLLIFLIKLGDPNVEIRKSDVIESLELKVGYGLFVI